MAKRNREKERALDVNVLRHWLSYDPETGIFKWKNPPRPVRKLGVPLGRILKTGYRAIVLGRKDYLASHLAWFYVYGAWPPNSVDHVNRVRDDDRLANLRLATQAQNNYNQAIRKDNPTGVRGVLIRKKTGAYEARLRHMGREIYLGNFRSLDQAAAARRAAEIKYCGEFTNDLGGH